MPDSRGADTGERRRSLDKSKTRRIVSAPTFQVAQVITLISLAVIGTVFVTNGDRAIQDKLTDHMASNRVELHAISALAQLNEQAISNEKQQREIIGSQLTTDVQELREEVGEQAATVNAKLDSQSAELNRKLDALIEREISRLERASTPP